MCGALFGGGGVFACESGAFEGFGLGVPESDWLLLAQTCDGGCERRGWGAGNLRFTAAGRFYDLN